MNEYLEIKSGQKLSKEELLQLKKRIEELNIIMQQREADIKKKSIFDLSILNIINKLVNEITGNIYHQKVMKYKKENPKSPLKYYYVLINEVLDTSPKFNTIEFWQEVESDNIIILGSSSNNCTNKRDIKKISYNDRIIDKKDILDSYKNPNPNKTSIYTKIMNFINELIIYKYEHHIDTLKPEYIELIYNNYLNNPPSKVYKKNK